MKYDLKNEFNPISFLRTVDQCKGEVLFECMSESRLDLKSQLSKVLFLTVKPGDPALLHCKIECSDEDSKTLSEFLVIPK